MRVRVSGRCRCDLWGYIMCSDLCIMIKAPEDAPALLFFGGLQRRNFGGLRRRNNELHELTNDVGRRSTVAHFAAKHCSSLCSQSEGHGYVAKMLKVAIGRAFKIQKNICAILSKIISGKACAHDKRTKREKERPERAASPQPRATPWVSVYKRLRPVRAKVWANGWLLLLPLQGVGNGDMVPRALPWAF